MSAIKAIACQLPEHAVSNTDLARENPTWDMGRVTERTGVVSRRLADSDETAFDLSARACEALVEKSGLDLGCIDGILYCTQSPDYRLPGNAHLLHRHLGLGDGVLAFDYNLACSGYVYGVAVADALIQTGVASEVLLVTADTYSKHLDPEDRSARVLFGDGAAVTHVSGDGGGRIVASELCSHGRDFERFYMAPGGTIQMDGPGVWAFVNSKLPSHLEQFLTGESLTFRDIDLYIFHQASRLVLESLSWRLGIDPNRLLVHMADMGNLVSASIPFALEAALEAEIIHPGDRVLLCGYGAGMSYGSVLVEFE